MSKCIEMSLGFNRKFGTFCSVCFLSFSFFSFSHFLECGDFEKDIWWHKKCQKRIYSMSKWRAHLPQHKEKCLILYICHMGTWQLLWRSWPPLFFPLLFFCSPPHVFSHFSLYFHRNSTVLNSKVISVTIKPTPSTLSTPLEIEFSHLYNVSQSAL